METELKEANDKLPARQDRKLTAWIILLEEFKTIGNKEINFRIFVTDQCESKVDETCNGQYSAASMKKYR